MHFEFRNVWVWSSTEESTILAGEYPLFPAVLSPRIVLGVFQHGTLSVSMFYEWLSWLFNTDGNEWKLFPKDDAGNTASSPLPPGDTGVLPKGNYVVLSAGN